MAVIFLIKILDDNRIFLIDNHKKCTNTYKNQSCLRQAIKNRINVNKVELSSIMSQLLTSENILDDNPLIQSYINNKFISEKHTDEIVDLVEDQANNSYVSNYDYDIYKKKADTQDTIIKLLQDQLNHVNAKIDKLEQTSRNQDFSSRFSNYENNTENSITDLKRDIVSLRSENRLLMDKLNSNPTLKPIPEIDSISTESIQSIKTPVTPDNESINSRMIKITTRLNRIDKYLFND